MVQENPELLEDRLPSESARIFAEARQRVLAVGQAVLQVEDDFIVRVFPDGRRERVKPVESPSPAVAGSIHLIR